MSETDKKHNNYFTAPEEIIHLDDGTEVAVLTQWGIDNIKLNANSVIQICTVFLIYLRLHEAIQSIKLQIMCYH